ncbi:MAG: STAS domain-containing protein [Acidimicrobiia bacterium]|nr:STAS domain-containing protein [Acidimicrobiia bacterium]
MQTATRTILDAGNRLDAVQAFRLRDEADTAWTADQSVIVDVRSVEYMDMAGLSALAWIMVSCRRRDEAATLLGPLPPSVARLLDLTSFDRFFQVRTSP